MFASLENRQHYSTLSLNALKIHQALAEKQKFHAWAALLILSSAITSVDYFVGALFRLPISIISLPSFIHHHETDLPTFKEFIIAASKALYCAIGIIIFPLVSLFNPEKGLFLMEELSLISLSKPVLERKKTPLIISTPATDALLAKLAPDIIPERYKNKELVSRKDANWEKVSGLRHQDIDIKFSTEEGEEKSLDHSLFPERWHATSKELPIRLKSGKVDGVALWKHVATLLNIPTQKRGEAEVMKEIVNTLYRTSRKKPQAPMKKELNLPQVDIRVWAKLSDILPRHLKTIEGGNDVMMKWKGPLFLDTNLSEWEEVELIHLMKATYHQETNEPLWIYVAKRLNINTAPKLKAGASIQLHVIKQIIKTVYPTHKG